MMDWFKLMGVMAASLVLLRSAYNLCHFMYTTFLCRILGHGMCISKCGPWAVVTGATDGIGKAYARLLAAEGLDIVLVSRMPAKLEKVANEIRRDYGSVNVKTIAVDFTKGYSIYLLLETELKQLEVGISINNVGMSVGFGERFIDVEEKSLDDIINCNILSMLRMSRLVLPQMIKNKKGVIVNIGSLTGAFPMPLATVYGATKGFVDKFSCDLSAEVRQFGVTVQTVHPGLVVTNMSRLTNPTWAAPMPEVFVAAALSTLGVEDRTAAFWYHKIELYWGEMLSLSVRGRMKSPIKVGSTGLEVRRQISTPCYDKENQVEVLFRRLQVWRDMASTL